MRSPQSLLAGASLTAEAVCLFRAAEGLRPPGERVLEDPFAEIFLGKAMSATLESLRLAARFGYPLDRLTAGLAPLVVARHRCIDDLLLGRLTREGDGTRPERLLLLGTGYDTRPWRFASQLAGVSATAPYIKVKPSAPVEVIEVDHPSTLARRATILEAHGAFLPSVLRRAIAIDFNQERLGERLRQEGITPARPSFFVWEGVTMYLEREAVRATLRTLRELAAPGSELCLDFWYSLPGRSLRARAMRRLPSALTSIGERVSFVLPPEEAEAFLADSGFALQSITNTQEFQHKYLGPKRRALPGLYLAHALAR